MGYTLSQLQGMGATPAQGGSNLTDFTNYAKGLSSGGSDPTTQSIVQKFGGGKGTPGANNPVITGTDPRLQGLPSQNMSGNFMGSLIPAAGQVGADVATAIPKGLNWAGTRTAQAGVQTYNEFQNPGYDTAVDTGNPQRSNAGGTAKALPSPVQAPQVNTSNSETNINKSQTVLPQSIGGTVEPQQQGKAGAEQIGEQALGAANMVGTGAMLEDPIGAVKDAAGAFKSVLGDIAAKTGISELPGMVDDFVSSLNDKIASKLPESAPETAKTNPYDINAASMNRESASTNAVSGIKQSNAAVSQDLSTAGKNFGQAAVDIEKTNPKASMDIPKNIADQLKNIKESAKFSLPDFVANKDWTVASPTQAQDLITQLNRATFQARASGEFAVNQQLIDLTNQIKSSASEAFGSQWDKAYSDYSSYRGALDGLGNIINPDPNASPTDLMKQFNTITKLQESPEGQKFLNQATEAYKNESPTHLDLAKPMNAINQVLKSEGELEIANKGSYTHQLMSALKSPSLAARRIAMAAISLTGVATAGTVFRKQIMSLFSGK